MQFRCLFLIALVFLSCLSISGQEQRRTIYIEGTGNNKTTFEKWLERDVLYIITESEKLSALSLKTEDEQEQFVIDFWQRRDPLPDTETNEYKEEYYQRIAYANEHLSTKILGWKTDKCKIYIFYGKPDKIDKGQMTFQGNTNVQFEKWSYKATNKLTSDKQFIFIESPETKEFRLIHPTE